MTYSPTKKQTASNKIGLRFSYSICKSRRYAYTHTIYNIAKWYSHWVFLQHITHLYRSVYKLFCGFVGRKMFFISSLIYFCVIFIVEQSRVECLWHIVKPQCMVLALFSIRCCLCSLLLWAPKIKIKPIPKNTCTHCNNNNHNNDEKTHTATTEIMIVASCGLRVGNTKCSCWFCRRSFWLYYGTLHVPKKMLDLGFGLFL